MRFVDLFAGLGGFHVALGSLDWECVFACEIDEELRHLYRKNFPAYKGPIEGDIRDAKHLIPAHDVLCAGFPCQPFSKSGSQIGVLDKSLGTLFHEIVEIIERHRPRFVILENVGNFERHDSGRTWAIVRDSLEALGYHVRATEHKASGGEGLISPHHLGFPHHRERFFVVASSEQLKGKLFPRSVRSAHTRIKSLADEDLNDEDHKETRLSRQQIECVDHWNQLLRALPESEVPSLPSFPIWGDEFGATYPFKHKTPLTITKRELVRHISRNGHGPKSRTTKAELLAALPAYALRTPVFPDWKVNFINQNRLWFESIADRIPLGWTERLRSFPPSLRKLEWNCKGEERNLWRHILQFRPSGLRVKRYENIPALVSMTTTQIPILGPKARFITRREGLMFQGFTELFGLPKLRPDAFKALGNAVHVGVVLHLVDAMDL